MDDIIHGRHKGRGTNKDQQHDYLMNDENDFIPFSCLQEVEWLASLPKVCTLIYKFLLQASSERMSKFKFCQKRRKRRL